MKKIFKLLGVVLCIVCLVVLFKIFQDLIYSVTSVTCLESKPEDSLQFGQALAITDNYIAVGDPQANRVAIYSYDNSKDKWSRKREIYPPKNSIIDKIGTGFGNSLVFNQNQLIIGAFSDFVPSHFDDNTQHKLSNKGFVYSLQINEDNQNALMEFNLPEGINTTGYAVKVFDNKIALGTTVINDYENEPDNVLIVNLTTLKLESVIKPSILPSKQKNFGKGIAGNSKYLVISAPDIPTKGGVYLIDKYGDLKTISMSEISISSAKDKGGFSYPVALGNEFIAMNFNGGRTSIFKQSSSGWREIYSVDLYGSFSIDKSQLLISTGRYLYDIETYKRWPNHLLIDVQEDKAFTKSTIRWQWGFYFGHAEAQGAINSKYLLLSRNGKAVLLKKKYLPRDYVINRFFCKEK